MPNLSAQSSENHLNDDSPQKAMRINHEGWVECKSCGWKFAEDRITKHENVCTNQKKRQVFKSNEKWMVDPSQKKFGKKKQMSPKKQEQ